MSALKTTLPNVGQHQYALSWSGNNHPMLMTSDILTCTCWCGWDPSNEIAFLAHFDSPRRSRLTARRILDQLAEIAPEVNGFHTLLIGGKWWLPRWGGLVRRAILEEAAVHPLNTFFRVKPADTNPIRTFRVMASPYTGIWHDHDRFRSPVRSPRTGSLFKTAYTPLKEISLM